ncbi:hypothetical protein [Actinomadura madurae]|uniref:hypothetical protein n=1 Tax=Actinomadura madurae TaxID=1993 RepID=UPI0009434011|nr:hypothetical protein [Actinomadura madurae]
MGIYAEPERVRDLAIALVEVRGLAQSLYVDLRESSQPADEPLIERARTLVDAFNRMPSPDLRILRNGGWYLQRGEGSWYLERAAGHAQQTLYYLNEETAGAEHRNQSGLSQATDLAKQFHGDPSLVRAREKLPHVQRSAVESAQKTSIVLGGIKIDVSDIDLSGMDCRDPIFFDGFTWSRKTKWPPGFPLRDLRRRAGPPYRGRWSLPTTFTRMS